MCEQSTFVSSALFLLRHHPLKMFELFMATMTHFMSRNYGINGRKAACKDLGRLRVCLHFSSRVSKPLFFLSFFFHESLVDTKLAPLVECLLRPILFPE